MRILTNIGLMFLAPATLLGLFDFIVLAACSPLVIALMAVRLIVSIPKAGPVRAKADMTGRF
jgi:hypothetical protein